MNFKVVFASLLALLLVVFTAQNAEVVEIRFLFWKLEMSRAIVLFGVGGIGALVGWAVASMSHLASND